MLKVLKALLIVRYQDIVIDAREQPTERPKKGQKTGRLHECFLYSKNKHF